MLGTPRSELDLIVAHLGNGASITAVQGGRSVETSMGLSPLEGLVMGTRSGDIDPSIIEYLMHREGIDIAAVDTVLNKRSGLLGLSGLTSDMRDLLAEDEENQDRRARLAIDIFCRRVRRYVGGYLADMGGADAVVFTGGIGENAHEVRGRICTGLEHLGLTIDPERNSTLQPGTVGEISTDQAALKAWVIPTDEELLIARDTYRVVEDIPRRW